jgi:hypothetical protein
MSTAFRCSPVRYALRGQQTRRTVVYFAPGFLGALGASRISQAGGAPNAGPSAAWSNSAEGEREATERISLIIRLVFGALDLTGILGFFD